MRPVGADLGVRAERVEEHDGQRDDVDDREDRQEAVDHDPRDQPPAAGDRGLVIFDGCR